MAPKSFTLDPKLQEYATEEQWRRLTEWKEEGSARAAAKLFDRNVSAYTNAHAKVKKKAAKRGYAPENDLIHPAAHGMKSRGTSIRYDGEGNVQQYWNKTKQDSMDPEERVRIPDPATISKVSTLYDEEGNVAQQWVQEKPELVKQKEALDEYARQLAESAPRFEPVEPVSTATKNQDLLTLYPVSDHHFGMLAWAKETQGEDWDLSIAEDTLNAASDHLMARAEHSYYGAIAFMGDLLHYDSFLAVTPTNKNMLDTDTRFPKMVRTAIRSMRYMIENALLFHQEVRVIVEVGNHDLSSSIFLMEALKNIYEDERRVYIDTSPSHFHYYRFGSVLLGTHHGHGRSAKMEMLPQIMANDRPVEWGQTNHRYWFTGHVHHDQVKDMVGCRVESLRILASADAYAANNGWRSKRDMKAIVFHKDFGEVSRYTVNPEYLRAEKEDINGTT